MEAVPRTFGQYVELVRSMSSGQRVTMVVVLLMVVAILGVLTRHDASSSYVALSWGKEFTEDELSSAETTLKDAGLTDFRRDGHRLLVPAAKVASYNAALLKGGTLPTDWASQLEKQLERDSLFTTNRQLQMRKYIAFAKAAGQIIRAIDEIEEANVIPALADQRSQFRSHRPEVTATVSVKPRPGRDISVRLVNSIQHAVANMFSGLEPEHVTVLDQSTGNSYTGENAGPPVDTGLFNRIKQFETLYQERITEALAMIPDVIVAVNVELGNAKPSVLHDQTLLPEPPLRAERTQQTTSGQRQVGSRTGVPSDWPPELQTRNGRETTPKKTDTDSVFGTTESSKKTRHEPIGLMPKSVQVSVSIPETYYRKIARTRGLTAGTTPDEEKRFQSALESIEQQVQRNVRATVMKHIPAGSAEDAVTVVSSPPIDRAAPPADGPTTGILSQALIRWVAVLGLAVLAVWGTRMVHKRAGKLPTRNEPNPSTHVTIERPSQEPSENTADNPGTAKRAQLQRMVRENPAMTAAVVNQWIQNAQ